MAGDCGDWRQGSWVLIYSWHALHAVQDKDAALSKSADFASQLEDSRSKSLRLEAKVAKFEEEQAASERVMEALRRDLDAAK